MRRSSLVLGALLLCLTGCAGIPYPPVTDKLQRVATPRSVVLNEPLYWRLDYRPSDQGVVPGMYKASQENAMGTFYEGPPGAYFLLTDEEDGKSSLERREGGIWIPKNGGPARIWTWPSDKYQPSKQLLDRRVTIGDLVPTLKGAPNGAIAANLPGARSESYAQDMVIQQVALGRAGGGVAGGPAAGVAGAIGVALGGALFNAYLGMRDVLLFDPPVSDERGRQQVQAVAQTATTEPPGR